jgi:DNA-binding IscR family transcriptional regulator
LLLRHSGLLGAKKGKGGGYYLIKDPKEINMAHVYRILEGPIALLPCAVTISMKNVQIVRMRPVVAVRRK